MTTLQSLKYYSICNVEVAKPTFLTASHRTSQFFPCVCSISLEKFYQKKFICQNEHLNEMWAWKWARKVNPEVNFDWAVYLGFFCLDVVKEAKNSEKVPKVKLIKICIQFGLLDFSRSWGMAKIISYLRKNLLSM